MRFRSTRKDSPSVELSQAIESGLAPDGGLYVPEGFPSFGFMDFARPLGLASVAARLLEPFFEGDPALGGKLPEIATEALDFPVPLKPLDGTSSVLELFHGPTAAFKDVGARFLASCFARIPPAGGGRTVLVATSGDTGGAVAAAFHRKPGIEVAVLFPKGGVSPLQEKQLTCWGDNVRAFAVRGDFDACQRLVKEAFSARGTAEAIPGRQLTSANSISIGRLLPQAAYYALASLEHVGRTGERPGFVIPSGNVGNALAALWAMRMGLPIRELVLATNANRAVPDYFETGAFRPAPTVRTLANAMDVGNPSNLERMISLFPEAAELRARVRALSVGDDGIRAAIREARERLGEVFCPHTAAAWHARQSLQGSDWIVVATAHPAKFNEVIAPELGRAAPLPPQLAALMGRESRVDEIAPDYAALRSALAR